MIPDVIQALACVWQEFYSQSIFAQPAKPYFHFELDIIFSYNAAGEAAFRDPEIDMILCASGGDDTFRLLPYLFDHNELRDAVAEQRHVGISFPAEEIIYGVNTAAKNLSGKSRYLRTWAADASIFSKIL